MNLEMDERQSRRLRVVLLAGCLLAGALGAGGQTAESDVRRDATVVAVEKVMASVVNIATETVIQVRDPFEELFRQVWGPYHRQQPPNSQYSLGSGVVIDEDGYVLTNDHVVRRADKITVKFCAGTNAYTATVVASDPKSDVALLKLNIQPGEKFKAIQLAREDDLLLGETVLALGNPFGLGGSVSRGILSSKSRVLPKEGEPLDIPNWLQTDAPINLGNSGGPLVNLRGELIGINVAVLNEFKGQRAQGIGFAIPIRRVLEALSDIFPTEFVKAYWFGARVKVGTMPLVIGSVQPESPAGKAGLKAGDAILQVNGKAPKSFIDFTELLASGAGTDETLAVRRGTARKDLAVRLVPEKSVFNAGMIRDKLGLNLEGLTAPVAARYGVGPADAYFVAGVEENSPAAEAGLQRGMLVTAIDGQLPGDLCAAAKLVYPKKRGDRIQLELAVQQRMGNFNFLRQGSVELAVR
ncbi:MAG: trypsin-like peptidase domain-containing protein [Verrucomicrobiota bacterium]